MFIFPHVLHFECLWCVWLMLTMVYLCLFGICLFLRVSALIHAAEDHSGVKFTVNRGWLQEATED